MLFSQAVIQSFTDEWFDEINKLLFKNVFKSLGDFLRACNGGIL